MQKRSMRQFMEDDLYSDFQDELENFEENPNGEIYLSDEIDCKILKYRDAHFANDFSVMYAFYQKDDFRLDPEITPERIAYLAEVEAKLAIDLAPALLSELDFEEIASAKKAYEKLKDVYEQENPNPLELALADLILVEDEHAEKEIEAILSFGKKASSGLIHILQSYQALDPLHPGYGFAPYYAAICLGKLKEEKAIVPLLMLLTKQTHIDEFVLTQALKEIGNEAQQFLIRAINSRPISKENATAAFALSAFCPDPQIAHHALNNLTSKDVQNDSLFATYLIFLLEGITGEGLEIAKKLSLPFHLQQELDFILKERDSLS